MKRARATLAPHSPGRGPGRGRRGRPLSAQVPFERLLEAEAEPHNWLTYSGTYFSQRYSDLDQVTADNVGDLELEWVYQSDVFGPWQSTPLVVDGVMYVTQRPNDVVALDARTGRVFWIYRYNPLAQPPGPAAGRTTAAWPCWATGSSWRRSTPTSWPSTPPPAPSSGTSCWRTWTWPTPSPSRRWPSTAR